MDRDGTNDGYDLPLTRGGRGAVPIPVIASGGAGTLEHLGEARRRPAPTRSSCASILHYGRFTVEQIKQHLAGAGVSIRPIGA